MKERLPDIVDIETAIELATRYASKRDVFIRTHRFQCGEF